MLQKLRLEEKNVTLSLLPKFLFDEKESTLKEAPFPLGGISNHTTVFCNETGQWSIYSSDEHGFNNPRNLYKPALDVLMIGESFVHGACVPPEKNMTAYIRQAYPKTISLGMDGNGEVTTLASLMEYGPYLKPKRVIWVYAENTLGRANSELNQEELHKYFSSKNHQQDLLHKQATIDSFWQDWLDKKLKNHRPEPQISGFNAHQFLTLYFVRKYYSLLAYAANDWLKKGDPTQNKERFKEILNHARSLTQDWGGTFYFVYLATSHQGNNNVTSDHDLIIDLAKELQLNTIDSYGLIKAQNPMDINAYNGKGHYNEKGYQIFSTFLLENLQNPQTKKAYTQKGQLQRGRLQKPAGYLPAATQQSSE